MRLVVISFLLPLTSYLLFSCGLRKQTTTDTETQTAIGLAFNADSALLFCQQQCDFGPRTMNSQAHDLCEQWIIRKFQSYGMTVIPQKCELKGYDGSTLHSTLTRPTGISPFSPPTMPPPVSLSCSKSHV